MSLISSLYAGETGLNTTSTDLATIGDNISNANTIGFKEGRAAFEDLLGESLGSGQGQVGMGSRLESIQRILSQGAITNTGNATDMALSGNGFFVVKGTAGGASQEFLTRAGQFTLDRNGLLVNLQGLHVQGFPADLNGTVSSSLGDLQVGNATSLPKATTNVALKANLQSDAPIAAPWDPLNPTGTSSFSTSATVYDSLGKQHQVQVYFRHTAAGAWDYHAMTDGSGVAGGTAGTPSEIATGALAFDAAGKLTSQTQTGSFTPAGSTTVQPLVFNFGDPTSVAGNTGVAGITQFAAASEVSFSSQDGFSAGSLANVAVDATGTVTGSFTNGQTRVLGEVAVATVPAGDQLQRVGGNLYGFSAGSGQMTAGVAGQGGRGTIVAGALEQSNVDLAGEFVRMIAAQRGFQANSKTVQASDQLLQELMQLKR